ncbi:sensor histidine kinase [Sandaracinus amylolyticus]|uniref:sensor histidine kinase n=1 Tax=Sandaracinus amylolyticus TaxID=927083 RepID=UPI001F426FD6|nr:histidine kinase dimerization/phospho-acceptor domain-containing protein [Sandaracinus amylolyticus]UJR86504.1 Hypothetical protein I5071_85990 [Sandaracinus amylolyticus]
MTSEEMTTSELLESDLPLVLPLPTRVGGARRVLVGLIAVGAVEIVALGALCVLAGRDVGIALAAVTLAAVARALAGAGFVHAQRILHRAARSDPGSAPFAPSPRVLRTAERMPLVIAALGWIVVALGLAPLEPSVVPAVLAAGALVTAPAARLVAAPLEAWIARLPARDLLDPTRLEIALRDATIAAVPALAVGFAALAFSPTATAALALLPGVVIALVEMGRTTIARAELDAIATHVDALDPEADEQEVEPPALRTEIALGAWADVRAEVDAASVARRGEANAQRQIEREEQVRSRFMAAMGHELRSPLNSIVGFAQLLEDGADGPMTHDQRESVVMVRRSAEDLLRLLGDILDSARLDARRLRIKREWTPSVEIVTEAVRLGRSIVEGTAVKIDPQIQAGLPPVYVDRARIVQAVVATFRHAARGKSEGVLTVRAGIGDARSGARALLIEVRDDARSLGEDDLARIFDAFGDLRDSTSGRRVGGLGLALSLARKLVRLHDGDVWAECRDATSTRYVVAVPLHTSSEG